jgi:hypothetical protein
MDMEVLRKKISTFRGDGGRVRITDDQLYMEILSAWEEWKGSSKEFFNAIGVSKTGMAGIIGKAKRMRRAGHFPAAEFKEIKVEGGEAGAPAPCQGIEIAWDGGKLIRFSEVDQLVDFLKKVS